jgi:hypothetical protein
MTVALKMRATRFVFRVASGGQRLPGMANLIVATTVAWH